MRAKITSIFATIANMQLDSPIEVNLRLIEPQKIALKKLGLKTVGDLLYHFPVRYGDTSEKRNIGTLNEGEKAVIFGKIWQFFARADADVPQ